MATPKLWHSAALPPAGVINRISSRIIGCSKTPDMLMRIYCINNSHLGARIKPRQSPLAVRHEIIYLATMPARFSSLIDKSAIALSGLCLLHCLAGTLLLTLFTVSGQWLGHDVHLAGLMLALPLAAFALFRGVTVHGRIGVALLGAAGIALMATSLFVAHGGSREVLMSVAGVSLLGLAHWWNLRAGSAAGRA